jgi:hypothetical protein
MKMFNQKYFLEEGIDVHPVWKKKNMADEEKYYSVNDEVS